MKGKLAFHHKIKLRNFGVDMLLRNKLILIVYDWHIMEVKIKN